MIAKIGGNLILAFALAVILLIVNGIVAYRSVTTLIANNDRVIHSQEVLEGLQEILSLILQSETGGRGYLLYGDQVYLDEYHSNLRLVEVKIDSLRLKTSDNSTIQAKFPELQAAIASRVEILDERIKERMQGGFANVTTDGQGGEAKRRMDRVRDSIREIANHERILLNARVLESKSSGVQALLTFVIANALLLGLLSLLYYFAVRDIRERKSNEAKLQAARDQLEVRVVERTNELNELNKELNRSNRELQDFAFVASHDLQEPLRKIQAFGDRLTTKHGSQLNAEARDYIERMQGAAGRMHSLINDLLAFARVTTKAQPFVPTDLSQIVSEVLVDLEVRLQEKQAQVDVSHLPTIEADPLQMRQLFQNLIGNALKFHRNGVTPEIGLYADAQTAKQTSNVVTIRVRDNGIGFDEKYLDRIFTPFQRLHGRNEYEGTGIGLAICRKILERHGGTLTASSVPGSGSTFMISIPLTQRKEVTQNDD